MPTFDDLVAPSSPEVGEIAQHLREAVLSRFPNAVEQIDLAAA